MQDIQSMLSLFKGTGDYVHYYNEFLTLLKEIQRVQLKENALNIQNLSKEDAYTLMQKFAIEAALKKQMAEQLLDHLTSKTT